MALTRVAISSGTERTVESCGKECVICRRMYRDDSKVVGMKPECVTTYDRTIGCRSMNVVYGIWCDVCRCICYVGETGTRLYTRIQNHLSSIRADDPIVPLPVRSHFRSAGHEIGDVKVVGLERVWRQNVEYRRARERRWMDLLGTHVGDAALNKRYG